MTLQFGYAPVNGIRLHYAEAGAGKPLVLLLHGFPEFWYSWRSQLESLAPHFHVVAPDLRGYNLSDKPARVKDYHIDSLVADVIGLIDHFGASQAAVVGHDWGGAIAWVVAQKHPDRVSKLAVLQTPPAAAWRANLTAKQFLRSWYMFFFQLRWLPERLIRRSDFRLVEEALKNGVGRKGTFNEEDISSYKEALRQPGAVTAALNYYRANLASRLIPSRSKSKENGPGKIRVPTLFVYGEQDQAILPATVRGVQRFVEASFQEKRIPDSGHWVQNEAATEVNAALLEFLTEKRNS